MTMSSPLGDSGKLVFLGVGGLSAMTLRGGCVAALDNGNLTLHLSNGCHF